MSVKNGAVPNEETKTAFTAIPVHFPDVTEKLKTVEFLEASVGIVGLVEKFGKVFAPVVNDMNGNIKKLRQKYEEDTELHQDLEIMILKDQVDGELFTAEALLWLRRCVQHLCHLLQDKHFGRVDSNYHRRIHLNDVGIRTQLPKTSVLPGYSSF